MTYNWYKVFNKTEFEATELVSIEYELLLTGIGLKTFLVTRGNCLGITIDEWFLAIGIREDNPFIFNGRAIFWDINDDIWYGVPVT